MNMRCPRGNSRWLATSSRRVVIAADANTIPQNPTLSRDRVEGPGKRREGGETYGLYLTRGAHPELFSTPVTTRTNTLLLPPLSPSSWASMPVPPRARKRQTPPAPTGVYAYRVKDYSGQDSQEQLPPTFLLPPSRPVLRPTPTPTPAPHSAFSSPLASSSKLPSIQAPKRRRIGLQKRQDVPTENSEGFPQRFQTGTDGAWHLDDCWNLHGRSQCPVRLTAFPPNFANYSGTGSRCCVPLVIYF